jgi:hypothetical protein
MDHITIILVHYNAEKETKECLESLKTLKHNGFDYSVLVIDNASKEPFSLTKKLRSKRFEVVRSEANLGFTGGNNLGIWYANQHQNPDYFLLLNNDTVVAPDFLQHLYDYLKGHVQVGIVTPKIYFAKGHEFHDSYTPQEKGSVIWFAGGVIDWNNLDAFHIGVDEVDRGQFDRVTSSDFISGCCMLIPRSVIDRVGTFDKKYFLYLEDVDLSVRIKAAGYELRYLPTAKIWHKNAGSTGGSGSQLHQYYQTRNRLLFAFKHGTNRIRVTALGLAARFLLFGTMYQRRGVVDLILQRFGKQPVI